MNFSSKVTAICQLLPGAEVSDPWGGGHDAWKVGGKLFACIGVRRQGVAVKCASIEAADILRELGIGTEAPYFHASWLLLPEDCNLAELRHRIEYSYLIVRSSLPRKAQALLDPFEPGD